MSTLRLSGSNSYGFGLQKPSKGWGSTTWKTCTDTMTMVGGPYCDESLIYPISLIIEAPVIHNSQRISRGTFLTFSHTSTIPARQWTQEINPNTWRFMGSSVRSPRPLYPNSKLLPYTPVLKARIRNPAPSACRLVRV